MTMMRSILFASLLAAAFSVRQLRNGTAAPSNEVAKPADEKAEVVALRTKLQKMSEGLDLVTQKNGTLAHSQVKTMVDEFLSQFNHILKDSETEKNSTKALEELKNAQVSVHSLVRDMSVQQMRLMKEGDDEQTSLLLGVLMTKQKEPMAKQLEILESADFKNLKVVSAVLAAKDIKTPLFKQVAEYLDQHSDKSALAAQADGIPDKLKANKNGKPDVTPIVHALQIRVDALQKSDDISEKLHAEELQKIDKAIAKESKDKTKARLVKRLEAMKKKDSRDFKKTSAIRHNDLNTMKSAIDAINKGDMKALGKAQAALQASLKAMQSKNDGFLYLIQLASKSEERDCPYCAAQCVDKCHSAGRPYVACLTECADAGK